MAHRRDQHPGALAPEVAHQGSEAADQATAAEVHHAGLARQLIEERSLGDGKGEIHRLASLNDSLHQIDDDALGSPAPD